MTHSIISRVVVLVLVTFLTSFLPITMGLNRASYGDPCNKEVRCDSRNFLSCSATGVCECYMGDSMVYDETTRKCVTLAGERCQLTTMKGDNTLIVELPCVSGGNCTSGVCDCLNGYFERSNGFCGVKGRYEDNCTENEMCDSSHNLICGKDKKCVCDDGLGLSFEDNECQILAGHPCGSNLTAKCITGSTCPSQVCTCSSDHFQALNGTCIMKGRKNDSCNSNIECQDRDSMLPTYLVCSEGLCKCNSSLTVDGNFGDCVKPLGQSCTVDNCINGAYCTHGICQCDSNRYFETESKTCEVRRGYNDSCKKDRECQSLYKCSSNDECVCHPGKSFSVTQNRCAFSVGSYCKSTRYQQSCSECVPNASGIDERRDYDERGSFYKQVCRCNSGFTTSTIRGDGLCYATIDNTCDGDIYGPATSKQCLPGLICTNNRCKCMFVPHQRYNSTSQSCQSHVGGPCTNSTDCADPNTECVGETGLKTCDCAEGSVQNGRNCETSSLPYGSKCNQQGQTDVCDKAGGLQCTSKGICECPSLQEFSGDECVGLVGARCSVSLVKEDVLCGEGSYCKPFRGYNQRYGLCTCLSGYKTTQSRRCILYETNANTTSSSIIEFTTEEH